jgi:hypothetical protein
MDEVYPAREGFETLRPDWPSFKGGPCPPNAWLAWIEGRNPDYPQRILAETREGIYAALDRIEADDADPEVIICNHYHRLIPIAPVGLIQMMMGTPTPVYNGGLLHTHLCYFDPVRRRIGVPDGVAALVDKVSGDGASVTLVNTDPVERRTVLVQAGMFGEHEFTWGQLEGEARQDVNGQRFEVELEPSTQARLQLGMKRYAHRPAYGHPSFERAR